ncbi:MAG: glycosyltransferase family 2 protein [Coriobacteriia bacterium]|nr:glycosyltransferase family 2 protein [Coriobacteriia bacterium]
MTTTSTAELHSVVSPMYQEADGAEEFVRRTCDALDGLEYELIVVEDGCTDGTYEVLAGLLERYPRLRVVRLSRNFGHQLGITAGIDFARGDTVTVLDSDLQDPPEIIPEMIERWRRGADVVFAVREHRDGESAFKRGTAAAFYRLLRSLTDVDIPVDAGDFRLMSRRAATALRGMREHARFVRGMSGWIGLQRDTVTYRRDARYAGETKYPVRAMIRLALNGLFSFSTRPLQLTLAMGFAAAALGLAFAAWVVISRVANTPLVQGWASLMFVALFFGGAQLITIGIIGEYIGRIYDEVRGRPLYLVREVVGFDPEVENAFADSPLPVVGRRTGRFRAPR